MATIEERAQILSINCRATNDEFGAGYRIGLKDGYIIGANKQKAIDEKEIEKAYEDGRSTALAEFIDNGQPGCKLCREALINKACKWLLENCFVDMGSHDTDVHFKSGYIHDFLKAMREE